MNRLVMFAELTPAQWVGAVVLLLVLLSIGSSITNEEKAWLYGIAGFLAVLILADAALRRNGLRGE